MLRSHRLMLLGCATFALSLGTFGAQTAQAGHRYGRSGFTVAGHRYGRSGFAIAGHRYGYRRGTAFGYSRGRGYCAPRPVPIVPRVYNSYRRGCAPRSSGFGFSFGVTKQRSYGHSGFRSGCGPSVIRPVPAPVLRRGFGRHGIRGQAFRHGGFRHHGRGW